MGAAVDDEKISKNPLDLDPSLFDDVKGYRIAMEKNVVIFYNLHNPEDDMLERLDQLGDRQIISQNFISALKSLMPLEIKVYN